jgi:TolA-binding protein
MWRTLSIVLLLFLLVLSCSRVARQPVPVEGSGSASGVLNLGIQHYNEKRYNQAIAEYQKVLSDFPGSNHAAEAQFRIANVYHWGMKEPEEALVAYQTVVDNYPDSELAQTALVRIGSIYHWDIEKPEPHKAIEYYQRMLSQAPHSEYAPEALYWTGEAYMWTIEDVDKALEVYQSVVDSYPESNYAADSMLRIAEIYRNRQWDDPRAIELYDRIVSGQYEGLSVGQARHSLGLHYLNIRHEPEIASTHFKAAVSEFQKVLSDPDASEWELQMAQYTKGLVYQAQGDNERAVVEYQKVLDNYSDSKSDVLDAAKFAIARYHEKKGDIPRALDGYREIASNPDSQQASSALLQIAKQHRDSKEYDKAIETYREVVSRFPDSYSAAVALGSIARYYSERGECDRAIAELKTIIEKCPFDDRKASAQYRIGMYYRKAGRYKEAIDALQKGMEIYPDAPYFSHEQCQRLIAQCKKELDADGAKTFTAFISDTPVAAQATRQIDVLGARALSDAFKILERELDCVITYEEPSWEDPLVREMFEGGPVVPKMQRLTFQYSLEDPEVVIQKVLDQYHQQTDIARFELIVGPEGMYNVVPVKYTNKAGELVEYHSILDANISLSMQDVTHSEIMDEILRRLPQKLTPGRIFPGHYVKTSVSWDSKSARSCINQVFHEFNQLYEYKRSWHIRRGPASEDRPAIFSYHRIYNRRWHMRIEAARPLAEALKILERNFKRTITYEDTLYLRRHDVMRNRAREPQMPRGGIVDFSYSPDVPGSASRAVQNCLASYNTSSSNPGVFTMGYTVDERHGYIIHVFPDKSRDGEGEQGILVPYTPILSTIISISEQDKTPLDIVRTICAKAVESSGTQINVGEFAQEVTPDLLISYGVNDKPARVALTQFLKSIDKYLSWQFLYDPKSKEYVLNVHSITTE